VKPILIFEHIESSGPGLFRIFLQERSIPFEILRPNNGDKVPGINNISSYSGLCFCGGTESVMNPTNWMIEEIKLIQTAKEYRVPVIGHCLGGQLISKALGGEVTLHDPEEFGWSQLHHTKNIVSDQWLNDTPDELFAMQWHTDSFTIPDGASHILQGEHCINQAFIYDKMLAMQFHVEANTDTIKQWAIDLYLKHPVTSDSVQSGEQILQSLDNNFCISKQLANHFYTRWIEFVK